MSSNYWHRRYGVKSSTDDPSNHPQALSEVDSGRRDFLRRLVRWGMALGVLSVGAETTMQRVFKRSVLSNAIAALPVSEAVPPPPEPSGTIYWVAIDGSDRNTGTENSPFATVPRAVQACSSGDGIYIKAGTYTQSSEFLWRKPNVILRGAPGTTREQVIIQRVSGGGYGGVIRFRGDRTNSGDPGVENVHIYGVTIQAGPEPPEDFIIKNQPAGTSSNDWKKYNWRSEVLALNGYVRDVSFVNCVFRYYYFRGMIVTTGSTFDHDNDWAHNVEAGHCHFYAGGWDTAGGDFSIGQRTGYCHVHHCEMEGGVNGVVMEGHKSGQLIEYNHIFDQFRENGVAHKVTRSENPLIEGGGRTIIRHNIIHDTNRTAVAIGRSAKRVDVFDNLAFNIFDTHQDVFRPGLWVHGLPRKSSADENTGLTEDIRLHRNEVYGASGEGIRVIQESVSDGIVYPHNVEVVGNILYDNGRWGIWIEHGSNITVTGNILSNNGKNWNNVQYNNRILSQTFSDENTGYLPDRSFRWGESDGTVYSLAEWQSTFGKDGNSSELSMQYQAPSPSPSPPGSPGNIEISARGSCEGTAKHAANLLRQHTPGPAA